MDGWRKAHACMCGQTSIDLKAGVTWMYVGRGASTDMGASSHSCTHIFFRPPGLHHLDKDRARAGVAGLGPSQGIYAQQSNGKDQSTDFVTIFFRLTCPRPLGPKRTIKQSPPSPSFPHPNTTTNTHSCGTSTPASLTPRDWPPGSASGTWTSFSCPTTRTGTSWRCVLCCD